MVYLLCKKCKKYYELENRERTEEFKTCECGGELILSEGISSQVNSMLEDAGEKNFCPKCGSSIRSGAVFCKKCGYSIVGPNKNKIEKLNDKINMLAIFIGLAVSVIFLFIGSILFGMLTSNGYLDIYTYFAMVMITMLFFGGLVVGIISCDDYSDAKLNGGFLTLVTLTILGLLGGASFSVTVGMASAIASAYNSIFPSSSSSSSYTDALLSNTTSTAAAPSSSITGESVVFIFKIIAFVVIILLSGIIGSSFGVFIKRSIQKM